MNNSVPLILASKSKPRRDVLFSAGICPTIRVSNVDEPAALEREAAAMGVAVSDLSVEQRVMILATAKAEAQGENVSTVIRRFLTRWVNRRESDDWGEPDD